MKLLHFTLAGRGFVLPISLIREILGRADITPVDRAPEDVVGLLNVRGQIVTVLNPAVMLGVAEAHKVSPGGEYPVIIFKRNQELEERSSLGGGQTGTSDDLYALRVEQIGDVITVIEEDLEAIPSNSSEETSAFFTSIVRSGEKVLPLVHAARLIRGSSEEVEELVSEG
jgi:purine-binding chemotaxis protein CheW